MQLPNPTIDPKANASCKTILLINLQFIYKYKNLDKGLGCAKLFIFCIYENNMAWAKKFK